MTGSERRTGWLTTVAVCSVLIAGAAGGGYRLGLVAVPVVIKAPEVEDPTVGRPEVPGAVVLPGEPPTVQLSAEAIAALGVKLETVQPAPAEDKLLLTGSLLIDSNRLAYVHSRFSGEIVSVGTISPQAHEFAAKEVEQRPIRVGDVIKKGQLLAVVWSKEVGEKKSDLVEALSRVNTSKSTFQRLESLEGGTVSVQMVREARRLYEADLIAVDRAERTLRSWRESEDEIKEVHQEAERIRASGKAEESRYRESWANVEIRAPLDGILLENNVSLGEIIDSTMVLFKVGDLSRMGVLANVYEEDLPKLTALDPNRRQWQVRLKAEPEAAPIEGCFEVVGNVIDPGQHTAAVIGWISNPQEKLRVGQFITAEVKLPGVPNTVVVPNASVIDEGDRAFVFVAERDSNDKFKMREVTVVRRGRDSALLACNSGGSPGAPAGKSAGNCVLEQGEQIVTSGNLELFGVLQDKSPTVRTVNKN